MEQDELSTEEINPDEINSRVKTAPQAASARNSNRQAPRIQKAPAVITRSSPNAPLTGHGQQAKSTAIQSRERTLKIRETNLTRDKMRP